MVRPLECSEYPAAIVQPVCRQHDAWEVHLHSLNSLAKDASHHLKLEVLFGESSKADFRITTGKTYMITNQLVFLLNYKSETSVFFFFVQIKVQCLQCTFHTQLFGQASTQRFIPYIS